MTRSICIAVFSALLFFHQSRAANLDNSIVKLGLKTLTLPLVEGYPRLDGKSTELDTTIDIMARGARNRVVALYGTENDLGLILQGKKPALSRTITIQSAIALEGKEMPPAIFLRFKDQLKEDVTTSDKAIKALLEEIEESSSDALSKQSKVTTVVQYGDVVRLGIFEETDKSLCHSMLAQVRSETPKGTREGVQATSIALVFLDGKLLTIYVSSLYQSIDDLYWTRKMALLVRDQLIESNIKP